MSGVGNENVPSMLLISVIYSKCEESYPAVRSRNLVLDRSFRFGLVVNQHIQVVAAVTADLSESEKV